MEQFVESGRRNTAQVGRARQSRCCPPLSGKELRDAARKFRVGTSNIEGMGPRHIGLLGDDALDTSAMMCKLGARRELSSIHAGSLS